MRAQKVAPVPPTLGRCAVMRAYLWTPVASCWQPRVFVLQALVAGCLIPGRWRPFGGWSRSPFPPIRSFSPFRPAACVSRRAASCSLAPATLLSGRLVPSRCARPSGPSPRILRFAPARFRPFRAPCALLFPGSGRRAILPVPPAPPLGFSQSLEVSHLQKEVYTRKNGRRRVVRRISAKEKIDRNQRGKKRPTERKTALGKGTESKKEEQ